MLDANSITGLRCRVLYCVLDGHLKLDLIGRGGEIRTPDILLPKQARYQATLHPEEAALYRCREEKSISFCSFFCYLWYRQHQVVDHRPQSKQSCYIN